MADEKQLFEIINTILSPEEIAQDELEKHRFIRYWVIYLNLVFTIMSVG